MGSAGSSGEATTAPNCPLSSQCQTQSRAGAVPWGCPRATQEKGKTCHAQEVTLQRKGAKSPCQGSTGWCLVMKLKLIHQSGRKFG